VPPSDTGNGMASSGLPDRPQFVIVPLGDQHDRAAFSCGSEPLDRYLQGDSIRQDRSRGIASPFVMTHNGTTVIGFYTLSALSINVSDLPPALAKKLPARLPVGAALLGRMGIDSRWHGRRLGSDLLMDALARVYRTSLEVASYAVIVDAKEGAHGFYLHHGFQPFPATPGRLFLPMKAIAQLLT
jgi:GNAT superfamily N-acetyltransferase